MRKLLFALLLLPVLSFAQGTTTQIRHGASLPSSCSPLNGDVFFKTGTGAGFYPCESTNTFVRTALTTGTLTNTHCVSIDASGHFVDAGSACGSGSGSVTSVGVTVPSPLSASGSPVTSSGTIAITWGSGQIPAANLGSGSASATKVLQGDSSWVDRPYVVPVQFESAPTASQTARHVIPGGVGTVSIATNCPNCTFAIGTSATATTTFTLKKNGSSFGTVAVTSGGSVTWTVTATTFTSGDVITVVAPASPDATAAQIAMSLYATR